MPLFDMSPNIQESEAAGRKRSHDQFTEAAFQVKQEVTEECNGSLPATAVKQENCSSQDIPSVSITSPSIKRERSPSVTSDSELSSVESMRNSPAPDEKDLTPSTSPLAPAPNKAPDASSTAAASTTTTTATPSSSATMAPPTSSGTALGAPPKKKRKTKEEKEAEERERAAKKARREEEQAAKAKERAEKDAARAREKAEKDAVRAARAAEKSRADAEKAERERKKRDEEEKKKRAQPSLFAFMKPKPQPQQQQQQQQQQQSSPAPAGDVLGDVSPNKQASAPKLADGSPVRPKASPLAVDAAAGSLTKNEGKPEKSAYEKLFQSFFIKSDVTIAPPPFQMDEEARTLKSQILDAYIRGERGEVKTKPFDPVSVFQFNGMPVPRGVQHLSVKKVMAEIFGEPLDVVSGGRTESQQVRLTNVQDQLNSIPVKVLSFYEDVRPPYVGTVTSTPQKELRKLARRPTGRLLKLNYDYDSEAEWEEEEGEDLDDDEVEDEENEGDEEMADFLDDAEDTGAVRPAFLGETEPVSTGICFEDRARRTHNAAGEDCATVSTVYKYRMEFLLESLEHHHSIDPFSTQYWQPKVSAAPVVTADAAGSGKQLKITAGGKTAGMAPPPAPGAGTTAVGANTTASMALSSQPSQQLPDWNALIPKALFKDFKKAVVSSDVNFLTKAAIVDVLSQRFSSATKNQVRATLDFVAERCAFPGEKKSAKRWVLRHEHALNKE